MLFTRHLIRTLSKTMLLVSVFIDGNSFFMLLVSVCSVFEFEEVTCELVLRQIQPMVCVVDS